MKLGVEIAYGYVLVSIPYANTVEAFRIVRKDLPRSFKCGHPVMVSLATVICRSEHTVTRCKPWGNECAHHGRICPMKDIDALSEGKDREGVYTDAGQGLGLSPGLTHKHSLRSAHITRNAGATIGSSTSIYSPRKSP